MYRIKKSPETREEEEEEEATMESVSGQLCPTIMEGIIRTECLCPH